MYFSSLTVFGTIFNDSVGALAKATQGSSWHPSVDIVESTDTALKNESADPKDTVPEQPPKELPEVELSDDDVRSDLDEIEAEIAEVERLLAEEEKQKKFDEK